MYSKNDVYKFITLTMNLQKKIDKKIYEETGYVLHQVDKNVVIYEPHFGSICGQSTIHIYKNGNIKAFSNFMDNYEEWDYEDVEIPKCLKNSAKQKRREMFRSYWKN